MSCSVLHPVISFNAGQPSLPVSQVYNQTTGERASHASVAALAHLVPNKPHAKKGKQLAWTPEDHYLLNKTIDSCNREIKKRGDGTTFGSLIDEACPKPTKDEPAPAAAVVLHEESESPDNVIDRLTREIFRDYIDPMHKQQGGPAQLVTAEELVPAKVLEPIHLTTNTSTVEKFPEIRCLPLTESFAMAVVDAGVSKSVDEAGKRKLMAQMILSAEWYVDKEVLDPKTKHLTVRLVDDDLVKRAYDYLPGLDWKTTTLEVRIPATARCIDVRVLVYGLTCAMRRYQYRGRLGSRCEDPFLLRVCVFVGDLGCVGPCVTALRTDPCRAVPTLRSRCSLSTRLGLRVTMAHRRVTTQRLRHNTASGSSRCVSCTIASTRDP